MENVEKLNTRQWMLYRFLKKMYPQQRFITKKEICDALPQCYEMKEKELRSCRAIENDIRAINENPTIQKIIVSNKTGYKIGNKEEAQEYINKRFRRDLKNLKLNWDLTKKVKLNKQMRIAFGKERDFIETFMEA